MQNSGYYICVIANQEILGDFNKNIELKADKIEGFENKYTLLSEKSKDLYYSVLQSTLNKGRFKSDRKNSTKDYIHGITDVDLRSSGGGCSRGKEENLQFAVAVDYSNVQAENDYLTNPANYKVNKNMSSPACKFFKTNMSLVGQTGTATRQLCLQWNQQNVRFDDFINYTSLDNQNKALVDMLFSRETLEMDMSHGFQGNPNMGCVVQNQFEGNTLFGTFAQHFQTGDRIFIISSIFGGTGASGFPLLRKLLHKDRNIANGQWGPIKNAPIGAITVLPYYNVTSADGNDNSSVNTRKIGTTKQRRRWITTLANKTI